MKDGIGSHDVDLKPPSGPPPSYLTVSDESVNSGNFRKLLVAAPLTGKDGGASHSYSLSLDTVPLSLGGTNAETAQGAINNLLAFIGLIKGSCVVFDGTNWTMLLPGKEGQSFSIVNGVPAWTNANVPIASTSTVITTANETKAIPNSAQLTAGDGINIQGAHVAVDATVVRNSAITALQTVLNAAIQNSLQLSGDQMIDGAKVFKDLQLTSLAITAGNKDYTFPNAPDNLVGEAYHQSLSNKTLVNPIIDSGSTISLVTPSGNYSLKTIMPTSGRVYSFYDANCDGDIAIKSGIANAGCMAYGDGGAIRFSPQGTAGHPFISQGINAPTCDVLSEVGGGTNQTTYNPGDMLVADANGKLQKFPIGKPGQKLEVNSEGIGYIWQ
jgi:hypothetical protein